MFYEDWMIFIFFHTKLSMTALVAKYIYIGLIFVNISIIYFIIIYLKVISITFNFEF